MAAILSRGRWVKRSIDVSVNQATIGLDDGLLPAWHQTFIRANAG